MKPLVAGAVFFCLPTLAHAGCPQGADTLINCTFNNGAKAVTTCLQEGVATYAFGPTQGEAELTLTRHVTEVDMEPWHGFGRWIAEGFKFENGDYAYELRYAIDRLSEEPLLEADLWVSRGDQALAHLTCDPDSIDAAYPLALFDAKVAHGQVWDREEMIWPPADNK